MRVYQSKSQSHSILCTSLLAVILSACGGQEPAPVAPTPVASAPAAVVPAPSVAPVAPTDTAPATTAPAPEAAEHHKHRHHHHPMVDMLVADLGEIGIKPEQKSAVDAVEADLEKLGEATKEARAQLETDIAEGAAAGKLDKAKVDADVKKLEKAAESSVGSIQEAVNKLHKALDAAQRKKLVELMRAKGKEHEEHMKGEHGKGEHDKGDHGRMDKLGEQLGLTPEQREKLKTKLEAGMKGEMGKMKEHHEGMQKRIKAMGDAFETDKFDAKKAGVGEHAGDMVKMMTSGRIHFVEAVLTVLTPEQRSKFADHIRQHGDEADDD